MNIKIVFIFVLAIFFFPATDVFSKELTPQALIEDVAAQTIARLKKEKVRIDKEPKYIHTLIDELLIPHFDFKRMARWTLGKYWRKAKPDQKEAFVAEFKLLLIRTYASSLREYSDQKIKYHPFRGKLASGDVYVKSEIEQPGGFPIPINYRLYKDGDKWMVYDISIDDISLITNYRSSFSRQIRRSGIDGLIKRLSEKNN